MPPTTDTGTSCDEHVSDPMSPLFSTVIALGLEEFDPTPQVPVTPPWLAMVIAGSVGPTAIMQAGEAGICATACAETVGDENPLFPTRFAATFAKIIVEGWLIVT